MDPITQMAQDFVKSWQRFRQSGKARLFRIDTQPSMHHDLWRLFRASEMAPDNRSPYLMFNMPFANTNDFYAAAIDKLRSDYALVREGLAKDGVQINELKIDPAKDCEPEENFARAVHVAWQGLNSQFDYLMIVFLPETIENGQEWSETIERLMPLLPPSEARVAVADTPEGVLADLCARLKKQAFVGRFILSSGEMQDYLLKIAAGGWSAISGSSPPTTKPSKQNARGADSGRLTGDLAVGSASNVLTAEDAAWLRSCMARAAIASSDRKSDEAIEALREAQIVCKKNELTGHEGIIVIAIANTFVATGSHDKAIAHYEEAIAIASKASSPVVVTQARVGLASTLFHAQNYDRAAHEYEQAAADARAADSEIMHIETLRMAGTCHNVCGRSNDAIRCWSEAVAIGSTISLAEIRASTIDQVGQAFVSLCEKHGMKEQARSVTVQIEAIKQQALLRERHTAEPSAAH